MPMLAKCANLTINNAEMPKVMPDVGKATPAKLHRKVQNGSFLIANEYDAQNRWPIVNQYENVC